MRWGWLIAAALVLAGPASGQWLFGGGTFAPGAGIAGTEARCTALGANCACSEPMQADITVVDQTDFPDSPDTTECPNPWLRIGSDPGTPGSETHDMVSTAGLGWGSATLALDHGYFEEATKNNFNWFNGVFPFTSADKSVCYRYYRQFSDIYGAAGFGTGCSPGDGTWRNKLFQGSLNDGVSTITMQVQEGQGAGCDPLSAVNNAIIISINGSAYDGTATLSPTITFDSCVTEPCRFEMCADATDLSTGQDLTFRARVTSLSGDFFGEASVPVSGTPMTGWTPIDGSSWGGDINHSGDPPGGSLEAYWMQAIWSDTDLTRWIGPACEIEGGCP